MLEQNEWLKESYELGKKFFYSWSILSAGTFTLLIPFIQSLQGNIKYKFLLFLIEILLLTSLLSSSIHPWVASKIAYKNAFPEEERTNFYITFQKINHIGAIWSYVAAVILIIIFLNINIL